MENLFLKYMNERLSIKENKPKIPGPVITISREYGCYGCEIAKLLIEKINFNQSQDKQWSMISNEILNNVAQNLMVSPDKISHVFGANMRTAVDDLLTSFLISQRYVSDINVIRHISGIVTTYANQGNVVIVGRAGCVLSKHIKKSVHVKLIAPLDWRVESVSKRFNISLEAGKNKVLEIDEKRKTFMSLFHGDKNESELFDLVLNKSTLTNDEIISIILKVAESRSVIK